MPIYNYHCNNCKQDFEVLGTLNENKELVIFNPDTNTYDKVTCDFCNSENVTRLLSRPGLIKVL